MLIGAVRRWWTRRITADIEDLVGPAECAGYFIWSGPSLTHYQYRISSPWGTIQNYTDLPVESEIAEKFDIILLGDILDRISNVRLRHLVISTEKLLGDTGRILVVSPLSSWVGWLVGRQEEFTLHRVSRMLKDLGFDVEYEHRHLGAVIQSYRKVET